MKNFLVSQLKNIYSAYVKRLSRKKHSERLKQQVVYLLSFPNNNHGLIEELNEKYPVVVCYTKNMTHEAHALKQLGIEIHLIDSFSGLRKTVKAVSESQVVLADNYFAFLGDIEKQFNQSFYQVWHATGAIKQFGLEDVKSKTRSKSDQERFKRVYDSFDYFVVGSKKMGEVFIRSYDVKESNICYTGFPRTDYLLKEVKKNDIESTQKKILYLPTYRQEKNQHLTEDMVKLMECLDETYQLKIKTHPHEEISHEEKIKASSQIELVKSDESADELLLEADILITDYSSVAFDYSLINPAGKLIFYWYDEARYIEETGLQPNIKESLPSQVCHSVEEVVAEIKSQQQDLSHFNETWNTYNDGQATKRLLEKIAEKMDGNK
ncbi:CDP-glycerol glycerophosphotransferase family protein [Vagococcus carniphilus]|uniref:CDP-glycerol glycerophosphotransferase family protein n=1 Tax=Vagococcus carniphilus TaxID=218144 RepID=UPI00288C6EB1|nr:CDP-glycerol glycerophosphotransferase family protein [Vagococcus carniphilus]MDT2813666.1 CDP-glycerol glycerophosphotransferase family protein [Vagococcus carniphilus]